MRNFSTVSEMKKAKDPGDEFWRQIRETNQTWRSTKILLFFFLVKTLGGLARMVRLGGLARMVRMFPSSPSPLQ